MNFYEDFFSTLKFKNDVPKKLYYIIEGTVGTGKSSLTDALCKNPYYTASYETVKDNPILEKFYENKKSYSFALQSFFLLDRLKQIDSFNPNKVYVMDRSIYGDLVFAKMLHDSGDMADDEFLFYTTVFKRLVEETSLPTLTIFLTNSTEEIVNKIKKRGREFELETNFEYWENLNNEYHDFIKAYQKYMPNESIAFDLDGKDFVSNLDDRETILKYIM